MKRKLIVVVALFLVVFGVAPARAIPYTTQVAYENMDEELASAWSYIHLWGTNLTTMNSADGVALYKGQFYMNVNMSGYVRQIGYFISDVSGYSDVEPTTTTKWSHRVLPSSKMLNELSVVLNNQVALYRVFNSIVNSCANTQNHSSYVACLSKQNNKLLIVNAELDALKSKINPLVNTWMK